jgi:hypothetical protein
MNETCFEVTELCLKFRKVLVDESVCLGDTDYTLSSLIVPVGRANACSYPTLKSFELPAAR